MEEIQYDDLVRERHKKMRNALNYFQRFLVSVSASGGFVSDSAFGSLIGVPVGIGSFAVGIKLLEITAKNIYLSYQEKKQKRVILYLKSIEVLFLKL